MLKWDEYGLNRRCRIVPKHNFKGQEDFQQKKVSSGTEKQETSGSIHWCLQVNSRQVYCFGGNLFMFISIKLRCGLCSSVCALLVIASKSQRTSYVIVIWAPSTHSGCWDYRFDFFPSWFLSALPHMTLTTLNHLELIASLINTLFARGVRSENACLWNTSVTELSTAMRQLMSFSLSVAIALQTHCFLARFIAKVSVWTRFNINVME